MRFDKNKKSIYSFLPRNAVDHLQVAFGKTHADGDIRVAKHARPEFFQWVDRMPGNGGRVPAWDQNPGFDVSRHQIVPTPNPGVAQKGRISFYDTIKAFWVVRSGLGCFEGTAAFLAYHFLRFCHYDSS